MANDQIETAFSTPILRNAWALLLVAGLVLGWNKGQLPRREVQPVNVSDKVAVAPDLQLYREIIAEVRQGREYYDAARQKIPQFGFPIASPLNWRLPTYAWVFSRLPGPAWIQALLVGLSAAGIALAFIAQSRINGVGSAAATAFLLFGVVHWAIDGDAYLAQEPWAAALIVISLAAHALGRWREGETERRRDWAAAWGALAVTAGIAAVFFRELALPYCGVACLLAIWNRRWSEAAGWTVGIAAFLAFFGWHVSQVRIQLAGTEIAASAGLTQWLRFGALDFVLLTTRMNSLLFSALSWLLWLYLLAALLGLARRNDETSRLACFTALAYLMAFAILGRPENFYWGLMPAPALAWGAASAPRAIGSLWTAAFHSVKSASAIVPAFEAGQKLTAS